MSSCTDQLVHKENPGEEDEEEEGEEEEEEETPDPLAPTRQVVAKGKRIKLAMGQPVSWYSGLVFDEEKVDSVQWEHVVFDDGDFRKYKLEECRLQLEANTLAAAVPEEQGVIANETGHAMVARVTYYTGIRIGSNPRTLYPPSPPSLQWARAHQCHECSPHSSTD